MSQEIEEVRKRVAAWNRAAPILEKVRQEDIRQTSTSEAIEAFSQISNALKPDTERLDTGLIEQQRWFRKIRNS